MANNKFSKKEALSHGFRQFKKHFWLIVCLCLVYIGYYVITGLLDSQAGKNNVLKTDVKMLYKNQSQIDYFYQYLTNEGFINEDGDVQSKLQDVTEADGLTLPDDLKSDREIIYNFLNQYRYRLPFSKPFYYFFAISLWVLYMLMNVGIIKISLMISRDENPEFSELFSNISPLISYILATICYTLVLMGGFLLLIIPGIIFSIMFMMYSYLIVDQSLGPIESLKRSRQITKGSRMNLFVFGSLLCLFNLAGLLCLVIGLLITIPVTWIAIAYVYDCLQSNEEEPEVTQQMGTV